MKEDKKLFSEIRNINILMKRYIDSYGSGKTEDNGSGKTEDNESDKTEDRCKSHFGLTHTHMMILGYLQNNRDKDVYQKDIEKAFSIRGASATNLLKRMEKQGLITRKSVPGDARLKKIEQTKKTKDIAKQMDQRASEVESIIRKGLTNEELDDFFRILDKMKENMED